MESWKTVAIVIAVLALVTVGGSVVYGARMRGVAQAHIELAREDSIIKEALQATADELRAIAEGRQEQLDLVNENARLQRVRDSLALAQLRDDQDEARAMTLAAIEDLPPEVMTIVQPVIDLYEIRIGNLERQVLQVEGERDQANERAVSATLTSTSWMETALGYERALEAGDAENANLRLAVEALESAIVPSFGLRLKLGWWMLPVGAALGYGVASAR